MDNLLLAKRSALGGLLVAAAASAGCGGGAGFGGQSAKKADVVEKQTDAGSNNSAANPPQENTKATTPQQVSGAFLADGLDCVYDPSVTVSGSAATDKLVGCRLLKKQAKVALSSTDFVLTFHSGDSLASPALTIPTLAQPASAPYHVVAALPYTDHGSLNLHVTGAANAGDYTRRTVDIRRTLGTSVAGGPGPGIATGAGTGAAASLALTVDGLWPAGPGLWQYLDGLLSTGDIWAGPCTSGGNINSDLGDLSGILGGVTGAVSTKITPNYNYGLPSDTTVCFRAISKHKSMTVQQDGMCYYMRACDTNGSHACASDPDQLSDVVYIVSALDQANNPGVSKGSLEDFVSKHLCQTATN